MLEFPSAPFLVAASILKPSASVTDAAIVAERAPVISLYSNELDGRRLSR